MVYACLMHREAEFNHNRLMTGWLAFPIENEVVEPHRQANENRTCPGNPENDVLASHGTLGEITVDHQGRPANVRHSYQGGNGAFDDAMIRPVVTHRDCRK